jgi:ankyrin repeat protein
MKEVVMTHRALSEKPSLELDRKRAKQLVAAARARDAAAIGRLAALHPRFAGASAAQIAAQVKLHHAQLAIAREYGIASWPRLKAHVQTFRLSERARADALVGATFRGDLRTARLLLEREPELARRDVWTASACGERARLALALEREPALARRAGGPLTYEPIVYACFSRFLRGDAQRAPGIVECVRLLLRHGADPNAHYFVQEGDVRERQTCLYAATGIANNAELTRALLEAGADVNELESAPQPGKLGGTEALYHASEFADVTCLGLLLEAGPYRESTSYCLGRALDHDNEAAALLFLEHGADPNTRIPWAHDQSHLHKAAKQGRSVGTLRAMLERGGDPNALDALGLTPYRLAARHGHDALVAVFEAHGAHRVSLTPEDLTLGQLARGRALERRPDFTPDPEVLRDAVKRGDLAAVRALLDAGADIEAGEEMPPLHTAAYWGRAEVLALLLERGASTRSRNSYGGSALDTVRFASLNCVDPHGGIGTKLPEEIAHGDYERAAELLIAAGAALPANAGACSDAIAEVLRRNGVPDAPR